MSLQDKQTFKQILAEYMGKQYYTSFILQSDIGRNVFVKNGEIIRIEHYNLPYYLKPYQKHLQQIQHLKWRKNESENLENEVFWSVIWNGYKLYAGGASNINGAKVGKWIELFEHFLEKSQIFYIGNYQDGIKTGKWISQFQDTSIGGGFYKENGQKDGRWTEIENYFREYIQIFISCYLITYGGVYDNGTKVGIWSLNCNHNHIGGGQYDINGLKTGKWRELYEYLLENHEIFIEGEYQNGIRGGFFKIILNNDIIGGGEYNQNGLKIGYWIELAQCFNMQQLLILIYL
ncbi:unnamed protein product [Paramecium primaurelia]|uniref:Uncharacterized protein n=1 Tax=Paramecium primaurelia TaxID=5886 RepID=A0A8S1QB60_PARPR|nr:unnamed protein product [Paramecium primaurelia]